MPRLTMTGVAAVAMAAVLVLLGYALGWSEFVLIGWIVVAGVLVGVITVLLPRPARVGFEVKPSQVFAGKTTRASITVRPWLVPLGGWRLVFRVGPTVVRRRLGWCRPGRSLDETVEFTAERRGILDVGPLRREDRDPWGFVRRSRTVAGLVPVRVWPRIVALESLAQGMVRDLDGVTSDRVTASDLNIHSLRSYVPGDDLRHVHWRASAHSGELLVRQYQDTLHSRAAVILDTATDSYPDPDDFELAVSVAASFAVRAVADDFDVRLAAGSVVSTSEQMDLLLDACCELQPADSTDDVVAESVTRHSADAGFAVLVTGPGRDMVSTLTLARRLRPGARNIVVRVAGTDSSAVWQTAGTSGIQLATLNHLPVVLPEVIG